MVITILNLYGSYMNEQKYIYCYFLKWFQVYVCPFFVAISYANINIVQLSNTTSWQMHKKCEIFHKHFHYKAYKIFHNEFGLGINVSHYQHSL
jgi:hypothetical protein